MAILEVPRPAPGADAANETVSVSASILRRVIETEATHATAGLLAGVVVILVGALMIFAGINSSESALVIEMGENSLELTSVWPGIFFALAGAAVIWLTRPKVTWQAT